MPKIQTIHVFIAIDQSPDDEGVVRQTQAFHAGEHDKIEEGTCLCCGQHYTKNLEQSNLSRSGYCVECGWNP